MVSLRRGVREFLVLSMILLIWGSLASASWGGAAEGKSEKSRAEPARKSSSLLRALASALGLSKSEPAKNSTSPPSDAKKKQEEARNKALEEAQTAYEKERRELQQRLRDDPLWKPSHEQVGVIKVKEHSKNRMVHSFCLNTEGNLLVCCGRNRGDAPSRTRKRGQVEAKEVAGGEILLFSPEGEKLGVWALELEPQAVCMASDGSVYVGGAGKLSKLDKDGKPLLTADSPNVAELPPLPSVPEKKAEPPGEDSEAAQEAKQKEIAALQKKVQEALKEYQRIAEEAGKSLKPDDDASMEAYQAKIKEPAEKLRALQEKLMELQTTPEMRAMRLRMERERRLTITGMAVTDRDVFVACMSAKGYGYAVWRTDRELKNPKKLVERLAGCCGQMDIQASEGELWVAHNGRHKVEHYDRDGKRLSSFGKRDRTHAEGFGGCCEPKNLRFAPNGELFASESGPPTCVKRFTTTGKFLGVMVAAPWQSGCVRVTTEFRSDLNRFFVLNSSERTIHVFAKKPAKPAAASRAAARPDAK